LPSTSICLRTIALALALAPALRAQTPPPVALQVEADRPVGAATDYPLVEPHLSVSPQNPRRWLVAAMAPLTPDNQSLDCATFASGDGGGIVGDARLGLARPHRLRRSVDGDPRRRDGARAGARRQRHDRPPLPDGGRTWPEPALHIRGSFDHAMFATDATGGIVYLVGASWAAVPGRRPRPATYVARSVDGGRSFVRRGLAVLTNVGQEAITPVVLADGALAFGTIDHHDASGRRLERRRAWLVVSRDSGATFSAPSLVTESCSRTRFTAWPSLATTPPRDGRPERLFFTCEADGNHGVLFARSDDQGDRWTAARRIDGGADSGWTKTPTMAVSASGLLAVTWLDARDDATGRCWHLYGTVSLDGGRDLPRAAAALGRPSCPHGRAHGEGVLGRFPSGGEYHGLAALGPREFVAVWPDARDGRFQLRSVRFRVPN
jgi:hypothetical protein